MARRARLLPVALAAGSLVLAACSGGSAHKAAATPSPTATSPTPSATATTASGPLCPLTGTTPAHGQDAARVAVAIKIDNINAARPQAGVDRADVVVEELVEGGLTRLFAVFQCNSAPRVEPIRSARTSDADLLALLHGSVFGFSGSNPGALPPIRAHGNAVLISFDTLSQYYARDPSRPAPHNVFSSTSTILAAGVARRKGLTAPPAMFHYGAIDASATPASTVSLRWPQASAAWTYSHGAYLRTQNGTPDIVVGGRRIAASNVVIMSITLGYTGLRDVLGNSSPLDQTVGGPRPVWVLRDGKVVRGSWVRRSANSSWQLLNADGKPILLKPGATWVELLPRPAQPLIR